MRSPIILTAASQPEDRVVATNNGMLLVMVESMRKLQRALRAMDIVGPRGSIHVALSRARGHRLSFQQEVAHLVTGASILEVGGPSAIFGRNGLTPIYSRALKVDNVNYAGATLWEPHLSDGGSFSPEGRRLGTQWLREATELGPTGPYDVVVSSHTLEHCANPLKALREWRRVCDSDGALLLVLPHRDGTFDHRRPLTGLDHMRADEQANMGEADDTHADEVLAMHDVGRDPGLASWDELRERIAGNPRTRAMHHHVFSTRSALELVAEADWVPVAADAVWQHDIVILARKRGPRTQVSVRSPFPSDRS